LLLALVVGLSACQQTYYTDDTLFDSLPSSGWRRFSWFWETRHGSTYSCDEREVEYVALALTSKASMEFTYWGTPPIVFAEKPGDLLGFRLRYINLPVDPRLPRAECAVGDVRVEFRAAGQVLWPVDAFITKQDEKQYECHYAFDTPSVNVTDFVIQIAAEKMKCSVPPLKVKRETYRIRRGGGAAT
jgi:hypothetical protein